MNWKAVKVIIFEVCRSPEIQKQTETIILSKFFNEQNIPCEVYSNDGIWPQPTVLNKNLIRQFLNQPDVGIVHLAMHGDESGLILRWSDSEKINKRVPEDILTDLDIQTMGEWRNKILVSGACSSDQLAKYFLEVGAAVFIAPSTPISWVNLGNFFCLLYNNLFCGHQPTSALELAISQFPEYSSYRVYS